jgi:hypothetical protein
LIERNGPAVFWWFTIARWACIPFSLLAGYVCFRWARDLYGTPAGFVALLLWCFDPLVLGHAQLITPDIGATAFGALAAYLFWKWLKKPTWTSAFLAGVVLGSAELCKTSWIILFPLWPLLWFVCRVFFPIGKAMLLSSRNASQINATRQEPPRPVPALLQDETALGASRRREAAQLVFILTLALYVLNLGYGFDGTCSHLGDFQFVSTTLRGQTHERFGNRFKDSWLGDIPVPLPQDYLMGIDIQKRDFENRWLS